MIIFSPCRAQYSASSGTRAIVPSSFITSQITPAGFRPASRARSTAASVWPARSSTPPERLFSGNTWPGWTRSRGRLSGSIATWIVCARSCAEIPVVTPSRASIETVNGVSNGDSFLRRHQVEAELVAALGREREADQAARLLGHEVDRLGRRELRGHRQVALVLAVLVVADDDHLALADVLDRLLDRGEALARAGAHARRSDQSLDVLGEHVDLDVDAFARLARPPSVVRVERLGDQRDREAVVARAR